MINFKPPKMEYRELWKPVENTNKMYFVSDKGRMFSKHRNKFLSPGTNSGYAYVTMSKKSYPLHRLIMKTFKPIENCDELTVNHVDLDKLNNCITNLEWCSQRENTIHFYKNGDVNRKGELSPNAKLTEKLVKEIRNSYNPDEHTLAGVANMYGVAASTIRNVLTNESWYDESYIPVYKVKRINTDRKGSSNHRSKLTKNDVLEIRKMFEDNPNLRITDIGKKYDVVRSTISRIIDYKIWKHI